ncbi:MAG: hypothetical protein PUI48_11030 [Oscillospiraceae bacterium]|nr:hypothetical protein [Oscillospiraceae bacterium]MDY6209305.1 hypothetical protein [Oscillospiraceae bacterium]
MIRIESSEKLLEVLCRVAEVGAYGSGEVTILPKGSGGFMKLYDGGIVKVKAVISASGFGGRRALLRMADLASERLAGFSGEGIIKISSPFPAVIAKAEESGFIRIEKDIEVIYRG